MLDFSPLFPLSNLRAFIYKYLTIFRRTFLSRSSFSFSLTESSAKMSEPASRGKESPFLSAAREWRRRNFSATNRWRGRERGELVEMQWWKSSLTGSCFNRSKRSHTTPAPSIPEEAMVRLLSLMFLVFISIKFIERLIETTNHHFRCVFDRREGDRETTDVVSLCPSHPRADCWRHGAPAMANWRSKGRDLHPV